MSELLCMMNESNDRGNVLRDVLGNKVVCMSVRQRRKGKIVFSYRWRLNEKASSFAAVCEAVGA